MNAIEQHFHETVSHLRHSTRGTVRSMANRLGFEETVSRMIADDPNDPRSEWNPMRNAWEGRGTRRRN